MAKRVPTIQLETIEDMLNFPTKEEKTPMPAQAESAPNGQQIVELEIPTLEGFPGHDTKFPLYTGQRLDDMVDSIKRHGVGTPILVWLTDDGRYIIISGHNRVNAARIAGLPTVPAIIKQGLTMDVAEELFYELNFRQRGFADMTHAQRALCIAGHYNLMKRQGTRTDLLDELEELINPHDDSENGTCAEIPHKPKTREVLGEEYGLYRDKIAQYCRLATLYPPLLSLLDHSDKASRVSVEAGYHLSFVESRELQMFIHDLVAEQGYKLDIKKAELLKAHYQQKKLDEQLAEEILSGVKAKRPAQKKAVHKVKPAIITRFFTPRQSAQEINDTIEKALELYFEMKGDTPANE